MWCFPEAHWGFVLVCECLVVWWPAACSSRSVIGAKNDSHLMRSTHQPADDSARWQCSMHRKSVFCRLFWWKYTQTNLSKITPTPLFIICPGLGLTSWSHRTSILMMVLMPQRQNKDEWAIPSSNSRRAGICFTDDVPVKSQWHMADHFVQPAPDCWSDCHTENS